MQQSVVPVNLYYVSETFNMTNINNSIRQCVLIYLFSSENRTLRFMRTDLSFKKTVHTENQIHSLDIKTLNVTSWASANAVTSVSKFKLLYSVGKHQLTTTW